MLRITRKAAKELESLICSYSANARMAGAWQARMTRERMAAIDNDSAHVAAYAEFVHDIVSSKWFEVGTQIDSLLGTQRQ